jgi:FkbM family methyltransferase
MIEFVHRAGSSIRNARLLRGQKWLWSAVEPVWQLAFRTLSRHRGYPTRINQDVFQLDYAFGVRYDRADSPGYEPTLYQAFIECIQPGNIVFDIGAHAGIFTLAAAKRVGPNGQVFAFEPAPETVRLLRRHIAMNGYVERVRVVESVVSDVNGKVDFYVSGLSMAASLSRVNVEVLNPERPRHVPSITASSVTLDSFCARYGVKPNIMKIDAEGAESRILHGARNVLQNLQPVIFCEIHPKQMAQFGGTEDELIAYLCGYGYDVVPLQRNNAGMLYARLVPRVPVLS